MRRTRPILVCGFALLLLAPFGDLQAASPEPPLPAPRTAQVEPPVEPETLNQTPLAEAGEPALAEPSRELADLFETPRATNLSNCYASAFCQPGGQVLTCGAPRGASCSSGPDWVACNQQMFTCDDCRATGLIWCDYWVP